MLVTCWVQLTIWQEDHGESCFKSNELMYTWTHRWVETKPAQNTYTHIHTSSLTVQLKCRYAQLWRLLLHKEMQKKMPTCRQFQWINVVTCWRTQSSIKGIISTLWLNCYTRCSSCFLAFLTETSKLYCYRMIYGTYLCKGELKRSRIHHLAKISVVESIPYCQHYSYGDYY